VRHLLCVPRTLSFSEMDRLCNEVNFIPHVGRSVVYLQGDYDNTYYMIAQGSVALYLDTTKHREVTIGREFGLRRMDPTLDPIQLGDHIVTLQVCDSLNMKAYGSFI